MENGHGRLPRVYLAGKIGKGDWRARLFTVEQSGYGTEYSYDQASDRVDVHIPHNTRDGFQYAGPYFLGDDHGCYHQPAGHALIDPGYADGAGAWIVGHGEPLSWRTVLNSCLGWLRSADVMFCWLDSVEAHGTLVEIGYFAALGRPIFLATPFDRAVADDPTEIKIHGGGWEVVHEQPESDSWRELWFARTIASQQVTTMTPALGWQKFTEWWRSKMAGYWILRQSELAEGRPRCPTHRRSSSSWR